MTCRCRSQGGLRETHRGAGVRQQTLFRVTPNFSLEDGGPWRRGRTPLWGQTARPEAPPCRMLHDPGRAAEPLRRHFSQLGACPSLIGAPGSPSAASQSACTESEVPECFLCSLRKRLSVSLSDLSCDTGTEALPCKVSSSTKCTSSAAWPRSHPALAPGMWDFGF